MRLAVTSVVLATLLGAAAAGGAYHLYHDALPAGRSLPGTVVGGSIQPPEVATGDWLERERQELANQPAHLALPESWLEVKRADAGFEVDVAATLQRVQEHAQQGSTWERYQRSRRAQQGLEELELVWRFDRDRARRTLRRLADKVAVAPVNARLDLAGHRRVEHLTGRELDVEATLDKWSKVEEPGETLVLELATRPIAPEVTSDMIEAIDPAKVLGTFETSFKGKAGPRAINIRRAASFLDGVILAPEQVLSFNKVVGRRTKSRGFVDAPVIVADELEPGVGGGVCQVATTLHGAAVYAGLDVVRRRSHSRPSGYAPLGLDATVIDGKVDLRIKNPFDEPVIVHMVFPSKYTIRAEFLGIKQKNDIKHVYEVKERHPFYRRVKVKPELAPGSFKLKQDGTYGYDVRSVVRTTLPDGSSSFQTYKSKYYPVPEVYWVGPGVDLNSLPPLPEGAKHVELDDGKELELDVAFALDDDVKLAPARHLPEKNAVNNLSARQDGVRDVN